MSAAQILPLAQPVATVATVTPTDAKRWLDANTHNRSLRPMVVAAYARDMAAGRWQFNGEAIKFATDGTLLDGQHRLHAVVKSGATITVLIVNGLPAETQDVMDSGAKRQASDALRLAGVKNSTTTAAIARLALNIDISGGKKITNGRAFTHPEILDFLDSHPGVIDAAVAAAHYRTKIDMQASVLGYAWWRLGNVSAKATGEFFETIANSQTSGKGDPRAALISRLNSARRNNERIAQQAQVSLLFRAWNAWRKGQQVERFQIESRTGEPAPIPVPR